MTPVPSAPGPRPASLLQVSLQLNEQGLNVALYWRNKDPATYHSIVPTSAITGEGERLARCARFARWACSADIGPL